MFKTIEMTSANVIQYRIEKNGQVVGSHREHLMCKSHYEDLLKFVPLSEHTITPWGYDEEEEEWEGNTITLLKFLKRLRSEKINELLKAQKNGNTQ